MSSIFQVALPTPLRRLFDYLPPKDTNDVGPAIIGCRVLVPLANRQLVGIVFQLSQSSDVPPEKLRCVDHVIDQQPIFCDDILALCTWASRYYHHPIGEVFHSALPTQLRQDKELPSELIKGWRLTHEGKGLPKGALRGKKQQLLHSALLEEPTLSLDQIKELGCNRQIIQALESKQLIEACDIESPPSDSAKAQIFREAPLDLNEEQRSALQAIQFHKYTTYLLDGSTGSGKTEIYLHAVARVLQAGQQALILVPEIGLTPQTLVRFERRFAVPVVQLHSNISEAQRTANWLAAARGHARIVIGTRLAIFASMPNLGLIVIDEEHDLSFKQQDGLRYSARDLAVIRAHHKKIPLILGSATPALETLHNALVGRYQHLVLKQRAGTAQAPHIHCVDMRKEPAEQLFSASATAAMAQSIKRHQHVIVFINRRGYAPALLCHHCGWSANCSACDKRMTLHRFPHHLRCHHCDKRAPVPHHCPSCNASELSNRGKGTEKLESHLQVMFPAVDVIRVDQDSMQSKSAMAELNRRMHDDKPCILVGTQMLAKGHHFPKVTLVVLLDVDQGLFSGDFRGPERMGQLITQVSGRAGRGETPGNVLLQTHQPQHPLLQSLLQRGYPEFAKQILQEREVTQLPPFQHMVVLRAESKRADNAQAFLHEARKLAQNIQEPTPHHRYIGPVPALLEKRNERFRFQLLICFEHRIHVQHLLAQWLPQIEQTALASRTRWSLDVDPLDLS